jgi:hypothetical protein
MELIEQLSDKIHALIAEWPDRDALKVLHAVEGMILSKKPQKEQPEQPVLRQILKRTKTISRIDKDPGVRAFILGIQEQTTLVGLQKSISDRFGKARTPSMSALHRWLQKMAGETPRASKRSETTASRPFCQTKTG